MHEISARLERHFRFSSTEKYQLAITSFVAAFGLTLSNGWGVFNLIPDQTAVAYVVNLVIVFIMMFISLYIHFSAQKIMALKLGYRSDYNYWLNGFLISTFICFITFGYFPLFFTGTTHTDTVKKIRMGRFRFGVMHKDMGYIAFAAPFASMMVAMLLSFLYVPTENPLIFAFIVVNLLIAIYSLLPIPTFEKFRQFKGGMAGLHLFISSRWVYILVLSTVLFYSLMIFVAKVFTIIIALVLGIIMTIVYYKQYE
ncbi:hypothetical protein JW711_06460 [Candidatus Woesearchaeota archaeon]|nr:hypothetical protein [Candidatus Woesearchaeota archaeon]